MTLNFFKRTKSTQQNILLYHYLDLKPMLKQGTEDGLSRTDKPGENELSSRDSRRKEHLIDTSDVQLPSEPEDLFEQTKSPDDEHLSSDRAPVHFDERDEMHGNHAPANQKWDKVKRRIETLLSAISSSEKSTDSNLLKRENGANHLDEKANISKKDRRSALSQMEKPNCSEVSTFSDSARKKSSDLTRNQRSSNEQAGRFKHESLKPPLDVRELQTVAAMAKRLRVHARLKRTDNTE